MFRARICAILGLVMLMPAFTNAREVELSVENRVGGDSNVFRRTAPKNEDGFYEFAPRITLRERRRELNYKFAYLPVYQTFFGIGNVDGWDHQARGRLEWNATPRDTFAFTQWFSSARTLRLSDPNDVSLGPTILEESDRERIRRINAEVSYSRAFTPTVSGRVAVDFSDTDFDSPFSIDSRAFGGSLSGNLAVDEQTTLGLYASTRYRENRGVGLQTSSTAIIGNIAGTFSHAFPNDVQLSVQVGPSFIATDTDALPGVTIAQYDIFNIGGTNVARVIDAVGGNCRSRNLDLLLACPLAAVPSSTTLPPNAPVTLAAPADGSAEENTDVSYFAEIRLIKYWEESNAEFAYTRSEANNSGSSSSLVDTVSLRFRWRPVRKTAVSLEGEWSEREVVSDLRQSVVAVTPGPSLGAGTGLFFAQASSVQSLVFDDSTNSAQILWRANLRIEQRLTEKLTAIGWTSYTHSTRSRRLAADTSLEVIWGFVGLRYVFDPFVF